MEYLIITFGVAFLLLFVPGVVRHFRASRKGGWPPEFAGVTAGINRGPKGRNGAVALEEPDDDTF